MLTDPGVALDVFESMHWLCFHLEFEHSGAATHPCGDPRCIHALQRLAALGVLSPSCPHVVQVAVTLSSPLREDGGHGSYTGYFRVFGITAPSDEHLRKYVLAEAVDGHVEWHEFNVQARGYSAIPQDILSAASDPCHDGVWFRSGRIFF